MQEGEIDIIENNEKGWFDKIKNWSYENWQTILVILVVLIVGISAYNYNQQNNNPEDQSGVVATNDTNTQNNDQSAADQGEAEKENTAENQDQQAANDADNQQSAQQPANEETNQNTNKNEEQKQPEEQKPAVTSNSDNSGKVYTVSATRGEGITHLARHALAKYLEETGSGSDLKSEQKVYIEDYLQNRAGSEMIEVGHQESFSEALIKDAIASSKKLSEKQIENLKQYVKS